jgi:transposase
MLYTIDGTNQYYNKEKERPIMQKKNTKLNFAGQEIYVGLDTGKKSWKVTILTKDFEHKTFSQPPKPEVLVGYLRKHFPGARYLCVYEAGYFGFWIHDALREQGVECIVTHPADVPTKDKERSNRNDTVDARKLARNLRNGELAALYVPTRKSLEVRTLVRTRMGMVKKQTRCKNQIKALLSQYGYAIPEDMVGSGWSRRFIDWLENLLFETEAGKQSLHILLEELKHLRQSIALLTRQIRTLGRQEPYRTQVELLDSIPGIGLLSAMTFLTEIVDINRFKNLDHLASYVGLVPGENSSGELERTTGISRRRNSFLRVMLVECSWVAVRKDPALLMAFNKLSERMPKNRAIIRIARKLLSRIRYVLKHQEYYETCVVA